MHSPNFRTIVGNKLQAPWQESYQFLIDQASDSHTLESPIRRHHIIKGTRFTLRYELFSRSGLGFDDICDLGNRSPFFVRTEGFGHVLARLSWGERGGGVQKGGNPDSTQRTAQFLPEGELVASSLSLSMLVCFNGKVGSGRGRCWVVMFYGGVESAPRSRGGCELGVQKIRSRETSGLKFSGNAVFKGPSAEIGK